MVCNWILHMIFLYSVDCTFQASKSACLYLFICNMSYNNDKNLTGLYSRWNWYNFVSQSKEMTMECFCLCCACCCITSYKLFHGIWSSWFGSLWIFSSPLAIPITLQTYVVAICQHFLNLKIGAQSAWYLQT